MRRGTFFFLAVFAILAKVQAEDLDVNDLDGNRTRTGWTLDERRAAKGLGINLPRSGNRTGYIRNGENAQRAYWKFIVPIFQLAAGRTAHICGGSVIHPQWVLTAAHCFRKQTTNPRGQIVRVEMDVDKRGYKLHLGDYDIVSLRDGAVQWPIDRIVPHQRYQGKTNNDPYDIALIKLKKPIPLGPTNKLVSRIPLPPAGIHFDSGLFTKCFMAGWGLTDTAPRRKPNTLQQMETRMLAKQACMNFWGAKWLNPTNMCLGNGMRSQCRGDSGGPAICPLNNNFVLAGIASFGSSDCESKPGVLLKVNAFLDWISQETGIALNVLVGK